MQSASRIFTQKLTQTSSIAKMSTKSAFTYTTAPKIRKGISTHHNSKSKMSNVRGCVPNEIHEINKTVVKTFTKSTDFKSPAVTTQECSVVLNF